MNIKKIMVNIIVIFYNCILNTFSIVKPFDYLLNINNYVKIISIKSKYIKLLKILIK